MRETVVKCDVCGHAKDCKAYWQVDVCDLCAQDVKVAKLLEAVKRETISQYSYQKLQQRMRPGIADLPLAVADYAAPFPKENP